MKKNRRLLIVVGALLLLGGISLAYFVGRMLTGGEGATTKVITANIKNSEVTIEGILNIEDYTMLPGHQSASGIKVNAKGNNELIPFNIIWEGTNTLGSKLKFKVYKSSSRLTVDIKCNEVRKPTGGGTMLYEECSITNEEELGEVIQEGEIPISTETETVNIALDQFITSTEEPGTDIYYYVIIEYPNEDKIQNDDMLDKSFSGVLNIEPSETEPDIQIASIQVEQEDGTYQEQDEIPTGYTINTSKSKCTNDVKPSWNTTNKGLLVKDLTKSGTTCNLFFSKPASNKTLETLKLNTLGTIGKITGPSCNGSKNESCYSNGDNNKNNMAENGVYDTVDDYGKTYVFRGFVQNNWVKFGKKGNDDIWWRIIRINGNGTIRLIYAGTGSSAPATDTDVTQIGTKAFNSTRSDNRYVGFMYNTSSNSSQEDLGSSLSSSTIKGELDTWWGQTTLENSGNKEKIDVDTGFCNDRSLSPVDHGSYKGTPSGGTGTTQTAYAGVHRVWDNNTSYDTTEQEPTLKCANPKRDLFTGPDATLGGIQGVTSKIEGNNKLTNPVGLITMDEVIYAGGFAGQNNDGYWLYTKQGYWTMSPYYFDPSNTYPARVFYVNLNGYLRDDYVSSANLGVRPVINLKAGTQFTFTDGVAADIGTTSNPYIVEGAE